MGGNKSVKEMGKKHGKDGAVVSRVCPRTGLDTSGLTLCVCPLSQAGPATFALPLETPCNLCCSSQQEFAATNLLLSSFPPSISSQSQAAQKQNH